MEVEGVPIVDPVRLTLILSNPTKPRVISNLTPCLVVITIKIYDLILLILQYSVKSWNYNKHIENYAENVANNW